MLLDVIWKVRHKDRMTMVEKVGIAEEDMLTICFVSFVVGKKWYVRICSENEKNCVRMFNYFRNVYVFLIW